MLVGHYGVSLTLKSINGKIPLWVLFVAAQFVDVLWSMFVIAGIEKVRITPGITASNPFDLYYMPYTHSIVAAIFWSVVSFLIYQRFPQIRGIQESLLVSLTVLSHWFLDLLVHRPDLPLYNETYKVGLGLWNYPIIAFLLEIGVLLTGMILYLRATISTSALGKYGMTVFCLMMAAIQALLFWGPAATNSGTGVALIGLMLYIVFASIAHWLDQKRSNFSMAVNLS